MQLDIRRQGIDISTSDREHVSRRIDFALGRFAPHIHRVAVHFAEVHGPKGGIDKRCRVLVRMSHHDVTIEDADGNLDALIDRAVNRAGIAVRGEMDKRHGRGRGR